ncbi:MAG: PD-(D/E)XK nuclease family protein [Planctomycetaceae bacterium]|nr:PD-(D/E)XK nuclease family protein [Planctomycetaceae bacterium]
MTALMKSPTSHIPTPTVERDYISYSAISTYQQCPLKYFFKYIEGLPEETVSTSLVLGGAIHSAAEFHFNELMIGNAAPDHDTLLAVFWDAWRGRAEEVEIRFGKSEDLDAIAKLADRILTAFRESELSQPHGTILGVEEQLRGELVPGIPDLLARIDLIVETDDAVTVTDLKTARTAWSPAQAEDSAEQLLLYSELVGRLVPRKKVRLEFAVITKAAKPVAERLPVTHDQSRIERTKRIVERVWRSIETGNVFPSPSPIACGSCPFRSPCRHWVG